MSFSYDPDAPSNRDYLRGLIPDTNASSFIFHDSELDNILALYQDDMQLSLAQAWRTIAASQSMQAIFYQVAGAGGFLVDRRTMGQQLAKMADKIEERAASVPFEFQSTMDYLTSAFGEDQSNYGDSQA